MNGDAWHMLRRTTSPARRRFDEPHHARRPPMSPHYAMRLPAPACLLYSPLCWFLLLRHIMRVKTALDCRVFAPGCCWRRAALSASRLSAVSRISVGTLALSDASDATRRVRDMPLMLMLPIENARCLHAFLTSRYHVRPPDYA